MSMPELSKFELAVSALETLAAMTTWTDKKSLRQFKTRVNVVAKRCAMIAQLAELKEPPVQLDIEGSDLVPASNPAEEEIKRRSRRNDA